MESCEKDYTHYTGSLFYEIELTAKYCRTLGAQVFGKLDAGISIDEFIALDTIMCNQDICQRDLARLIFKDRANTGKLLDSLEKKGYISRNFAVKNNRPVRIILLTEMGHNKVHDVSEKLRPHTDIVRKKMEGTDFDKIRESLRELRNVLLKTIEIQI